MKLSNALKFAKDTLPCFIALVTYPNGPQAHEAVYLRHIWTADMIEALKAARLTSAKGAALNRQHLGISFTAGERVDDDFADRLLDAIAREGVDYCEKKKRMSDSLGYENGWGEGELVLADGHNEQDLQDLLLGRRAELPIQSFTVIESRFGIPGPGTTKGPGTLTVTVSPRARCVLTLQKRGTDERLSWPGGVFTAGMDWLALEEQKVRVVAGPIEILLSKGTDVSAKWSAPLEAARTLDDLERDARFRSWMDGSTIDLDIWTDKGEMPSGQIRFGTSDDQEPWIDIVEAIQALSRVVPPERRPNDLKVSLQDFASDISHHRHLTAALKSAPTSIRVVNETGIASALRTATHIVFPWVTRLGSYFIVSVIERAIRKSHWEETMMTLTTENGRLLRGTAMPASGATDALVAKEVEWARDRAEASGRKILSYHPDGDGTGSVMLSEPDDGSCTEQVL
ncbi:hypothetical protein [Brevundimonas sp.]|uniref:hypothetical protein n=1 Tax=Brevundimonas sp. TaxID=1871086 RepID=UPI001AD07A82|nr:hypothetical protein [Brevundimonas sp.]MBN9464647.1 hypothetical protein [Brevundimonas sp.]